jgi:hypothetical protein
MGTVKKKIYNGRPRSGIQKLNTKTGNTEETWKVTLFYTCSILKFLLTSLVNGKGGERGNRKGRIQPTLQYIHDP